MFSVHGTPSIFFYVLVSVTYSHPRPENTKWKILEINHLYGLEFSPFLGINGFYFFLLDPQIHALAAVATQYTLLSP